MWWAYTLGGGLQYLVTILYIVVLYYIYELVDKK